MSQTNHMVEQYDFVFKLYGESALKKLNIICTLSFNTLLYVSSNHFFHNPAPEAITQMPIIIE